MKINKLLLILFSSLILSSCLGDLDVTQSSAIPSNSMWKSEGDATAAMYGLYNVFRSAFNTGYIYWGEYRTGLWGEGLTGQTSRDQVYQNQIPTDHKFADWTYLYSTINLANLILKYAPNITFKSQDTKNKVLANAYFVRGFCYYWIGRIWGDAPLLLDGFESDSQQGLYPTRNSADSIFIQVGSDIDNALKIIPESVNSKNMASAANINMLKADYDLWMYKVRKGGESYLDAANSAVGAVLNKTGYSLESNFANIFNTKLGKEVIFAWSYVEDEYTGGYPSDYLVPSQYVSSSAIENPIKVGSHQQWCFYTDEYKKLLSSNSKDQRTIVSYQTYFDAPKNATFQWINKFAGTWKNATRIFDSDIIIYRYADALLFDAEIKMAQNNISGAVSQLNKIAERAYGLKDYYPSTLSSSDLNEAIITEREKEFSAEGKLWWDFIRMGVVFKKAPYLVGRDNEVNVLLWPISQNAINKNPNLKQTVGYDK